MKRIAQYLIFSLLLSPIISYVLIRHLKFPKPYYFVFSFIILIFSVFFFREVKILYAPKFLFLFFCYSIMRAYYHIIYIERDKFWLTNYYYIILFISTFLLIIIVYNVTYSKVFIDRTVKFLKILIFGSVIISIIQVFDYSFLNVWKFEDLQKYESSLYLLRRFALFGFSDPNDIGLSFVPMMAVFFSHIMIEKARYINLYLLLVGVISFLSNTRYVMLGFLILLIQVIYTNSSKLNTRFKTFFSIIIVVATILLILNNLGYDFEEFQDKRLFREGSIEETSRYKAISNFIKFFPENPFWGTGVHLTDEIRKASHKIGSSQIHVAYLSHLVSYGIFGSFLLFGFWFYLSLYFYRNAKKTGFWGSFFAMMIYLMAQLTLVYYSFLLTGMIFALIFDKYYMDSYKLNMRNRLNFDKI